MVNRGTRSGISHFAYAISALAGTPAKSRGYEGQRHGDQEHAYQDQEHLGDSAAVQSVDSLFIKN